MEKHSLNTKRETIKELKDRTFLFKDELLPFEENEMIEFKNYQMPLNIKYNDMIGQDSHTKELIDNLKKQFCGFLNNKGGRLYIGINDDRIVIGVFLNNKLKDKTRNDLVNLTSDFFPNCRNEKIKIVFLPVKNKNTGNFIKELYVIKVIIKPGNANRLYSVSTKEFKSFMRLEGQCVRLTALEIEDLIKSRAFKNEVIVIEDTNFNDPEPEVDCLVDRSNEGLMTPLGLRKSDNSNDSKKVSIQKKAKLRGRPDRENSRNSKSIIVKFSNLSKDVKPEDIHLLLKNYSYDKSVPILINKIDKDYIFAIVHFFSASEAVRVKNELNNISFMENKIQIRIAP